MRSMDLVDPFGRTIRDLRISITDRCNFRCTYCMPAEGMVWLPRSEVLSFEEIERLARIFVERYEVDGLRLTGGEPTVRAHLPVLVEKLARLRVPASSGSPYAGQKPDLSMTTNGATFRLVAHELRDAGLDRVNISLDTLQRRAVPADDPARRTAPRARRDRGGQGGRLRAGQGQCGGPAGRQRRRDRRPRPVRSRPRRRDPVHRVHAARRRRRRGGAARSSSQDEIVAAIAAEFPLEPVPARGAAPADRWRYLDGKGTVGVIPTVTKPFCGDCDRVRLTAEGELRTCLFATREFDLRALLRDGADDDAIAAEIERAVGTKWAGHQINQVNFIRPNKSMSQIGG